MADTPGHGKLRHVAFEQLVKPQNLQGIIFLVDAADLSSSSSSSAAAAANGDGSGDTNGGESLRQTAEFLYELLITLQKRATSGRSSQRPAIPSVLIAANKLDLFTALPAPLVKSTLENEITQVRDSKNKGLLDSGVGMDDNNNKGVEDSGERDHWLGEEGESKFTFAQLNEFGIGVTVKGGNVTGGEGGADVEEWWDWIAGCL